MKEKLKCKECDHEFENNEHYVESATGKVMCETCFWKLAIKKLGAMPRQY